MNHPGWLLPVVTAEPVPRYRRVRLTLSCGCVVTRPKESKKARCELQRACKWKQPEATCSTT